MEFLAVPLIQGRVRIQRTFGVDDAYLPGAKESVDAVLATPVYVAMATTQTPPPA